MSEKKDLNLMFPCVKGGICSDEGLTQSENKGEVQVGLEMNQSVPGELSAEISRLNNEIKCLNDEIRMMMVEKDDQIKEQKQGKKNENSNQEGVMATENKGELQVGLEMNQSVPGELSAEISRLNNEIKCLNDEIRMMMVEKDDQIKEQKQGKKNKNSNQEGVMAQITALKDELMKLKDEIQKIQDARQLERQVAEKKQQKETEKLWHEINMRFDSKVEELLKEKNCTVENKEADTVLTPAKVKDLNRTGQMIQEITQSIKQEKHKHSIVPQDEQKCGLTLD